MKAFNKNRKISPRVGAIDRYDLLQTSREWRSLLDEIIGPHRSSQSELLAILLYLCCLISRNGPSPDPRIETNLLVEPDIVGCPWNRPSKLYSKAQEQLRYELVKLK